MHFRCNYYKLDGVFHLAAETHVDNSIRNADAFIQTNINGTFNLLKESVKHEIKRFLHVSTDEVFGSLTDSGFFDEKTAYGPRSPYSASKASSDLLVNSYVNTYALDAVVTNCSNNYGALQHGEKLIPTVVTKIRENKSIPVYGDGSNIRDWLYVGDHCNALDLAFHKGVKGEKYCIGGDNEISNLNLVKKICGIAAEILNKPVDEINKLITFVEDRKGHDFRYAIDSSKIKEELQWSEEKDFEVGLKETVKYYLEVQYKDNALNLH